VTRQEVLERVREIQERKKPDVHATNRGLWLPSMAVARIPFRKNA
jgi:hypothetical protein